MLDIVFDVQFFLNVTAIEGLKLMQRTKIFHYKYQSQKSKYLLKFKQNIN